MKNTHLLLTVMIIVCSSSFGQPINTEFTPNNSTPILLGKINKQGLSEGIYGDWFLKNYNAYNPNTEIINTFKEALKQYTITVFMGTWCGDSKLEVPRFYKILDTALFPLERLTIIALNRENDSYKQSPGGEEEGLGIHRVPTFIFYKNGKEVNRIVESPISSLEEDIALILNNNYTPKYETVLIVQHLLETESPSTFTKKVKKLMPELRKTTTSMYELNTYASVLFAAGQQEEAILVATFNTKLFPDQARTFISLANKQTKIGRDQEARMNYEQALQLEPANKQATLALAGLGSRKK